jgi:hypothetical protein
MSWEHIQIIDTRTGEVLEKHPEVQMLEDQVAGLQRDVRGWASRYALLKRDKDLAARNHELYPDTELAFNEWKLKCNHKNSPFTADRFWVALPFMENPKYGLKMVLRAIEGMAYDAYSVERRNGSPKVFNEWWRLFQVKASGGPNADQFEEWVCKAPPNRQR